MWSINVNLRLPKATIEFVWWVVGRVGTVIFVSNPRLCCVVVGVLTIIEISLGMFCSGLTYFYPLFRFKEEVTIKVVFLK